MALTKPKYCRDSCPLGLQSSFGFCMDDPYSEKQKVAFLLAHPSRADALEGSAFSEHSRYYRYLIQECGLTRDEVLVSFVLRCYPPLIGKRRYPIGKARKQSERACREYDKQSIVLYRPNIFVLTFGLDSMNKTPVFIRLAQFAVRKALRFREEGYRPMVLFGEEAVGLFSEVLGGSVIKSRQGHWWEGCWPYNSHFVPA